MDEKKPSFSLLRIVKFLGAIIGITLIGFASLSAYDAYRVKSIASLKADADMVEYRSRTATLADKQKQANAHLLGPKDDFYRIMQGGIQPNDSTRSDTMTFSQGGALHKAFQLYVKKDDVLARTPSEIKKGSWRFDFGIGFDGRPYWGETIEWCIRLKMPAGDEKIYAYTLSELSKLYNSESIGLNKLPKDIDLAPETALNYVNLDGKKELLVPIQTVWLGASAEEITVREITIKPNSFVCQSLAKK